MLLLPQRAQSLEDRRRRYELRVLNYVYPGIRPASLAELQGHYDAVMANPYYPRSNDPIIPHVDEQGRFGFFFRLDDEEV